MVGKICWLSGGDGAPEKAVVGAQKLGVPRSTEWKIPLKTHNIGAVLCAGLLPLMRKVEEMF